MQYKESLKYAIKDVKQDNSSASWRELGLSFSNNGDFVNAELAFRKAFELNDDIFDGLYFLKKNQNKLENLPKVVKRACGSTFKADLFMQRRDYSGLLKFISSIKLDSTFNELSLPFYEAEAHYLMGHDDSARLNAEAYFKVREKTPELEAFQSSNGWTDVVMYGALGVTVDAKKFFPYPKTQINQDLSYQFGILGRELYHLVFLREYSKAATKLEQMNREFPRYGNYSWLSLPAFDRIKKEYPRFQDVINGLKLPPKVSETNRLKL